MTQKLESMLEGVSVNSVNLVKTSDGKEYVCELVGYAIREKRKGDKGYPNFSDEEKKAIQQKALSYVKGDMSADIFVQKYRKSRGVDARGRQRTPYSFAAHTVEIYHILGEVQRIE